MLRFHRECSAATRPRARAMPWPVRFAAIAGLLPALALSADPPLKLSGPMVAGGNVSSVLHSPDGSRVVYRADQDTDGVVELYSAPAEGGTPIKLNAPLIGAGDVGGDVRITPDGSTVVYLADQDVDNANQLFSVPIDGGPVTRLSRPLPVGGSVFQYRLSPDGSTVVYLGDQDTNDVFELYSVPVHGGTAVKLNGPVGGNRNVLSTFRISADSSRVVYLADQDTNNVNELYSVPIGGGSVTKLNPSLPAGGGVGLFGLDISPDGSTVVYTADQITNNVHELFSVPIGGGTSVRLNGPLPPGGAIFEFAFAPDSSVVVYRGDQQTDGFNELYSVPLGGGAFTQLSDPAFGEMFFFRVSTDSSAVVYQTSNTGQEVLLSVPIGGGPVTVLNGPMDATDQVEGFELSDDGRWVVFSTNVIEDDAEPMTPRLFSVPIRGGAVRDLVSGFAPGSGIDFSRISPRSDSIVYQADRETPGVFELFQTPIRGGDAIRLSAPMVDGGDVNAFVFSPDGSRIAYRADQDTDEVVELFAVTPDVPQLPLLIFASGFEAP